jgi:hypothetical protein
MQMAMKLGDRVDPSVAAAPATCRAKGKKIVHVGDAGAI